MWQRHHLFTRIATKKGEIGHLFSPNPKLIVSLIVKYTYACQHEHTYAHHEHRYTPPPPKPKKN